MNWTAIVPVKPVGERKTRLAGSLSPEQRERLSGALLAHVLAVLDTTPEVSVVAMLSREPPTDAGRVWVPDGERGLNNELEVAVEKLGGGPMLIVHADLPLLCVEDVAALLEAAEPDGAIAPDRHGKGTNALALPDARGFPFAFGLDSLAAHRRSLGPRGLIVERAGLALDIDEDADLATATAAGFRY